MYFSCMKPRGYVTAWWLWDPVVPARLAVSMWSWNPWPIVVLLTESWKWTPRLSQPLRCLADLMWLPMIGLMASSQLCGDALSKQRKVSVQLVVYRLARSTCFQFYDMSTTEMHSNKSLLTHFHQERGLAVIKNELSHIFESYIWQEMGV